MTIQNFFRWWTIANTVGTIVSNFVTAGGPSVNAAKVAIEASKELERGVANGFLPPQILDGKDDVIHAAINVHPAIQNRPEHISDVPVPAPVPGPAGPAGPAGPQGERGPAF